MAEARQAVLVSEQQRGGIRLNNTEDGIELTFVLPTPSKLWIEMKRWFRRMKNRVIYSFWPASPSLLFTVIGGVAYGVANSNPLSVWRNGKYAHWLWNIDSSIKFTESIPRSIRIGYLSAISAIGGLSLLMIGTRVLLRTLLT